MKKVLSLFLSLLMIVGIISSVGIVVNAETYSTDGWQYTLSDNVATITGYTGTNKDIIIPDKLDGYAVKHISDDAFKKNLIIETLKLSENLESIGLYAFQHCTNLTYVYVPSVTFDLTWVGGGIFKGCSNLTEVEFAKNITKIPENICLGVKSLKTVKIPSTVNVIGSGAFSDTSLESVELPKYLESIENNAFANTCLESVVLPKYLKSLGYDSFKNCTELKTINIPKNVSTNIFGSPFKNCQNLENVTFDEGTTILTGGLLSNTGIKKVIIPSGVTEIEHGVFDECKNLTTISFPDSLKSIGYNVFRECTTLNNVVIPDSVTVIGDNCFRDCDSLTDIKLSKNLTTLNDNLFYSCDSLSSINIPDNVIELGDDAFSGCTSLKNVKMPKNLKYMGHCSFAGCVSLESIDIPATVNKVRWGVFTGCTSLKEVTIPYGVSEIDDEFFKGCLNLKKVTIPSTVTSIADNAFTYYGETTMRCVKGSVADEYAKKFEMPIEYFSEKIDITTSTVSTIKDYTYTGKAIMPNVSVKYGDKLLSKNVDYKVSYTNNVNSGKATVTITGIGDYTGNIVKDFYIKDAKLSSTKISLSRTSYIYDKGIKKPHVTISYNGKMLSLNKDYTVSYTNKTFGTQKVVIKGINDFEGTVVKTFSIKLGSTKITKITSKSKRIYLNYSKVTGVQRYQVYISTNKYKRYKKIATTSKSYFKSNKLVKGKIHYIKVRGYGKIEGKIQYTNWSTVKAVKIK